MVARMGQNFLGQRDHRCSPSWMPGGHSSPREGSRNQLYLPWQPSRAKASQEMKKTFGRVLRQRRGSLALFLDRNWPSRRGTLRPPTRNFLGKAHLVLMQPGPKQSKALALPRHSQSVYTPKSLPKGRPAHTRGSAPEFMCKTAEKQVCWVLTRGGTWKRSPHLCQNPVWGDRVSSVIDANKIQHPPFPSPCPSARPRSLCGLARRQLLPVANPDRHQASLPSPICQH